jgi:23S rRNA (adenine2030-N6)-methyltransferase
MNYRHAFHAGNFGDCMKHALLTALLRALQQKPAPLFVLDTHAGAGHYDLTAEPALRTNEAANGISRLLDHPPPAFPRGHARAEPASVPPGGASLADPDPGDPLADYLAAVRRLGLYPGSPALIRSLLRPDDRLACCELHQEDYAALHRLFRHDAQVSVHRRNGWEALKALLPPAQKRGLVLIDPPYEDPREFAHLAEGLALAHARFPAGVLAAWYPVKHRAPVRAFFDALSLRDVIAAELLLREPLDPARLNGCGVLIVNPPYQFEIQAHSILTALSDRLGDREAGAAATVTRLADE